MMDPRTPDTPATGWLRQVGVRLVTGWPAKMIGAPLGIAAFFVAYFWVLRHPSHPPTIMPLIAADRLVGFRPEVLPLYLSLWFYVCLAPALLIDRREAVAYGLAAAGLSLVGLGIFLIWPTAVPPSAIDWSQYPAYTFLKAVDATGNACPSLHVAFAVFTACWLEGLGRQIRAGRLVRGLSWLWCLGILYSTVATRQHVVLDVLAGAVLGAALAAAHRQLRRVWPGPDRA